MRLKVRPVVSLAVAAAIGSFITAVQADQYQHQAPPRYDSGYNYQTPPPGGWERVLEGQHNANQPPPPPPQQSAQQAPPPMNPAGAPPYTSRGAPPPPRNYGYRRNYNAPWGGGPSFSGPWNNRGSSWKPWSSGGRDPFGPRGPSDWFSMDRDDWADNWDDMLNAPSRMGEMPGGWTAPSVSVPNPVDVGDEFGDAARDMPDQMRNVYEENRRYNSGPRYYGPGPGYGAPPYGRY